MKMKFSKSLKDIRSESYQEYKKKNAAEGGGDSKNQKSNRKFKPGDKINFEKLIIDKDKELKRIYEKAHNSFFRSSPANHISSKNRLDNVMSIKVAKIEKDSVVKKYQHDFGEIKNYVENKKKEFEENNPDLATIEKEKRLVANLRLKEKTLKFAIDKTSKDLIRDQIKEQEKTEIEKKIEERTQLKALQEKIREEEKNFIKEIKKTGHDEKRKIKEEFTNDEKKRFDDERKLKEQERKRQEDLNKQLHEESKKVNTQIRSEDKEHRDDLVKARADFELKEREQMVEERRKKHKYEAQIYKCQEGYLKSEIEFYENLKLKMEKTKH